MSLLKKTIYPILSLLIILTACEKEFDTPTVKTLPKGSILTISDLRQMYTDSVENIGGRVEYRFIDDYSVYAVVTMDDKTGNIYKSAYIQDDSAAINLNLLSSGGIYEGDSIRVYLKGTKLSKYSGLLQIDSVSVDNNIIKQATNHNKTPETVSISQITSAYQAKLIKLENVEFMSGDQGKTYADAQNLSSENRYLTDCNGNQIIVRTSGYASFANTVVPDSNGSIIAIVGEFSGDIQLYIRSTSEVVFNEPTCSVSSGELVNKDFEDNTFKEITDVIAATFGIEVITENNRIIFDGDSCN